MITNLIKPAIVSAALVLSCVGTAWADGAAMLRRVDAIRAPSSDFSFDLKVQTSDGVSMAMAVSVRDSTKGLVQYTEPSNVKGRSLLFVERNMWVFIPGSQRPLRISPQQQILGGVSSADVARTHYSSDYSVADVQTIGDGKAKLHLQAKSGGAAYGAIHLTIDQKSNRPLEAEFFASGGNRKLKTVYFEGYKPIMGENRPTRLRIVDHLAGNSVTTMTYSGFKASTAPAAWFQPTYLPRLAASAQ